MEHVKGHATQGSAPSGDRSQLTQSTVGDRDHQILNLIREYLIRHPHLFQVPPDTPVTSRSTLCGDLQNDSQGFATGSIAPWGQLHGNRPIASCQSTRNRWTV